MPKANSPSVSWEEAAALLGVAVGATEQEIRQAYLQQVRTHPPDREPDLFERVRDAYEQLRNPALRARQVLHGPAPAAPLTTLLDGPKPARRFVGSGAWFNVLKEKS